MYQESDEESETYLKADGRYLIYCKVECIKSQLMGLEHNQCSDGRALTELMFVARLIELMLISFVPQKSLCEPSCMKRFKMFSSKLKGVNHLGKIPPVRTRGAWPTFIEI